MVAETPRTSLYPQARLLGQKRKEGVKLTFLPVLIKAAKILQTKQKRDSKRSTVKGPNGPRSRK